MNWPWPWRRAQAANSYDTPMYAPPAWVAALPDAAQLFVYEKGRYVDRFPVHYRGALSLESMLWERYGAGDYTVLPHFDGRLHPGHRFTVGTELDRDARRRLNEQQAEFAELAENPGALGLLGIAGEIGIACTAIDSNIRLHDARFSTLSSVLHAMAKERGAGESPDGEREADTNAPDSEKGGVQAAEPQT
jgi:hypothetical protein